MDVKSLPDFRFFPYPVESKELLPSDDPITLNTSSSWTYCGPLLTLESCKLPSSFNTWAEATTRGSIWSSLFSFLEYVHDFLAKNNQSHYWLTIRASKGSDEFDTPRWHTDDLFFAPLQPLTNHRRESLFSPITNLLKSTWTRPTTHRDFPAPISYSKLQTKHHAHPRPMPPTAQIPSTSPSPTNWKLTTTLLGPGTLFISPATNHIARATQQAAKTAARAAAPNHICVSVRCVGCAMAAESVRARLAVELSGHGIVQASAGECVFFRVGEKEGAVHSEPRSHGDRVFVNVVPGHEADLRALMMKWGMEYPRAWVFWVVVEFGDISVFLDVFVKFGPAEGIISKAYQSLEQICPSQAEVQYGGIPSWTGDAIPSDDLEFRYRSLPTLASVSKRVPSFEARDATVIVGSFGAVAVIEFGAIDSPFAQPRNAVLSQIIACFFGVGISKLFALNPGAEAYTELGGALACALTTAVMLLTKTTHPPAGATALLAVTHSQTVALGWFLFPVILLGVTLMQAAAVIINNIQRRYPLYWWTSHPLARSRGDVEKAIQNGSPSLSSHYEDSLIDVPRRLVVEHGDISVPSKDLNFTSEQGFYR
ncbi:O-methyltransferase, family 3 [Penicillium digitatum]|uniref:O-methyltransferase, family 3 n=1 Tax=Penicillium digitatum TaxID=36651 RepID=A0A7T6XL18_PENDI|nr:O-methyltransferase, family 3 [Penicillium digitatum]